MLHTKLLINGEGLDVFKSHRIISMTLTLRSGTGGYAGVKKFNHQSPQQINLRVDEPVSLTDQDGVEASIQTGNPGEVEVNIIYKS